MRIRGLESTTLIMMLGAMLLSLLCGCWDDRSAIEKRMEEFRYSTEELASQLIERLQSVDKKVNQRSNSRTEAVREMEEGRGGDAGRPAPNSMEAIVAEATAKLKSISTDDPEASMEGLLESIQASGKIDEQVLSEFGASLRESVSMGESGSR